MVSIWLAGGYSSNLLTWPIWDFPFPPDKGTPFQMRVGFMRSVLHGHLTPVMPFFRQDPPSGLLSRAYAKSVLGASCSCYNLGVGLLLGAHMDESSYDSVTPLKIPSNPDQGGCD